MECNPLQGKIAVMPGFFRLVRHRRLFIYGVAGWTLAVAGGFAALVAYSVRPGGSLTPPVRWPVEPALSREAARPTLVVFAHPRCPCTRATLEELGRIMERAPSVNAEIFFFQPQNASNRWNTESSLWKFAETIPGVAIHTDLEGAQAIRFGALTSGQTLLFDAEGNLLFRGGITPRRGERGDNPGSNRILTLLEKGGPPAPSTPTFGCSILADGGLTQ
jgi:hypothetical protein